MKIITIGRGDVNHIVLDDDQDMISRQHATLRIYGTGKMEIVSTGSNGTFVNGFRIKPNVPYRVTRKDVISFAHVRQLDWALVPDPFRFVRWGIIGTMIVGAICIAVAFLWPNKKPETNTPVTPIINVTQEDPNIETPKENPKKTPKEEVSPKQGEKEVKYPSLNKQKKKKNTPEKKPEQEQQKEKPVETIIPAL